MTGKSWYTTGFSKDSDGGSKGGGILGWDPDRVWIPAKESKDMVFVDDAPLN